MRLAIWPSIPTNPRSGSAVSGSSVSGQADTAWRRKEGKARDKKDMWTSEAFTKLWNMMNCGISVFLSMNVYAFTFFICYV